MSVTGFAMFALAHAFFLVGPGLPLALLLQSPMPSCTGFVGSLLSLFWNVLLLDALDVPVTFSVVLAVQTFVSTLLWIMVLQRRGTTFGGDQARTQPKLERVDGLLIGICIGFGGLLALHCFADPLSGPDTRFRWEFLATRLLRHGHLDFYPPVAAEDFSIYFYVDAIPPLVSLAYWWIYAATGNTESWQTAPFVIAQFWIILSLAVRLGQQQWSFRTGLVGAVILASTLRFQWILDMGQESGLLTVALAGMLHRLRDCRVAAASVERGPATPMALEAGMYAALAALSREYGWAFAATGMLWLLFPLVRPRVWLGFVGTVVVVAGFWYLRTWLRTGNPFYSLPLFGMAVNPVHVGLLDAYRANAMPTLFAGTVWLQLARTLMYTAPVATLIGLPAALGAWRTNPVFLMLIGLVFALWVFSLGYTTGGAAYATRVLMPAWLLLSLLVSQQLLRVVHRSRALVIGVIMLSALLGFTFNLRRTIIDLQSRHLLQRARQRRVLNPYDAGHADLVLPRLIPVSARILSDNPFLHARLDGTPLAVVPLWSPEVRFLFSQEGDTGQQVERLSRSGIHYIWIGPGTNQEYLAQFQFFRDCGQFCAPLLPGYLYRLRTPDG